MRRNVSSLFLQYARLERARSVEGRSAIEPLVARRLARATGTRRMGQLRAVVQRLADQACHRR
jgi:hypothetical protein